MFRPPTVLLLNLLTSRRHHTNHTVHVSQVALKRFVDDVAVQVIDAELVHALADILSPVSVYILPPDKVALIAGESEGSRVEREELTR